MEDNKIDEKLYSQVVSELARLLEIDESEISRDSILKDDLEVDSLDAFELITELEDKLEIEIPLESFKNVSTVQDIVDLLKTLVATEK